MPTPIILVNPMLAQAPAASPAARTGESPPISPWMIISGALLVALIGLGVYGKIQLDQLAKKVKFEEFKNQELKKKLKLALGTITKMEANPDLVHSREFNLDYLRMRMEEEVFHFAIVNQIKVKVKDKISEALRPTQAKEGKIGSPAAARQVDEIFDVEYEPDGSPKGIKRVLFRIQIKLTKLPAVPTSQTVSQIIDCIETYLSPTAADNWQPAMGGRLVNLHWDQKAKPTPLLVLEQLNEGSNVTIRTTRRPPLAAPKEGSSDAASSSGKSSSSGSSQQARPKGQSQSGSSGQSQGKSRGSSSRVSRSGRQS
ncbi:hypothetical protein H6G20_22830 [Desertifilum sp. FACHB-1129]|uniref:Uncharacterized protein n=2 Tax=Cyanophyceae TaxID=3028117 RepID=A0A1E5QJE1_9CYAN|nr:MULTISPECIES: hypothetical protein [Cyanophyceae]MCD8486734.1 hypothetical protein [Desertifilum sp.]MDA0213127.1 hypothetical protein [Cyanobacteria bacterium FC1]MDI9640524.1 hypothetical protein [Geitlerinema splendidum]MBD2314509.1 hypothetical protein [Desertifilum sp. FACHB-1129]MBD2321090.1 hypothetical protein [Desertifilum sp. FACHB-866]